jgi:alpha-beta hydrolase superfamily lysophospholipase
MYMISRYDSAYLNRLPKNIAQLSYQTGAGRQLAFYIPPRRDFAQMPADLWVLFGGNGAVALGWLDLIRDFPDSQDGFLLVDYPGFGACQGMPSGQTIRESSDQALLALADFLHQPPGIFEGRICLLGHSLGCATALQFAPGHQVRRMILLAPFTNMVAIARHIVGWPLCNFVPDHYDNEARLSELERRQPRPEILIIHGVRDPVVPVDMGRELAHLYPQWIEYEELPGGTHQSFFHQDRERVLQAMCPPARQFRQAVREEYPASSSN